VRIRQDSEVLKQDRRQLLRTATTSFAATGAAIAGAAAGGALGLRTSVAGDIMGCQASAGRSSCRLPQGVQSYAGDLAGRFVLVKDGGGRFGRELQGENPLKSLRQGMAGAGFETGFSAHARMIASCSIDYEC
jgi:hypothetical protein